MSIIVTRNVDDLPEPSRSHLEELLGKQLGARQRVFIIVDALYPEPSAEAKRKAGAGIHRFLADSKNHAAKKGISAAEADAAVNEAVNHVRRG